MESQLILAERLIGIAQRLDRPVVLHVVRADGIMLNLLKKIKPQIPLLWHGFLGSMETARELAALGCTISIAHSIWRVGTKLQDRLSSLRMPVLLETDYPYHYRLPGEPFHLCSCFRSPIPPFAHATGISLEALEHKCDDTLRFLRISRLIGEEKVFRLNNAFVVVSDWVRWRLRLGSVGRSGVGRLGLSTSIPLASPISIGNCLRQSPRSVEKK